jgi:RimJ/RimL family protein N-acetyltransferase
MIVTERLLLRPWRDEDREQYARMNADPMVREFFAGLLTRDQSDAEIDRFQRDYARDGFCMFAAELTATKQFIGVIGLQTMSFTVPGISQPAVEIGWRLAREHWGKGFAAEGARGATRFAFDKLRRPEVVAVTAPANVRSRKVMDNLGMAYLPELDFKHPRVADGHPLQLHVVYLLRNSK